MGEIFHTKKKGANFAAKRILGERSNDAGTKSATGNKKNIVYTLVPYCLTLVYTTGPKVIKHKKFNEYSNRFTFRLHYWAGPDSNSEPQGPEILGFKDFATQIRAHAHAREGNNRPINPIGG